MKRVGEVRRAFPPTPASVREARQFLRTTIAEIIAENEELLLAAQLVVSELATNAVEHAQSTFEVVIVVDEELTIAVHDCSPVPPEPRSPSHQDKSGRGLLLVDKIAGRRGCEPDGDGKKVWCELAL